MLETRFLDCENVETMSPCVVFQFSNAVDDAALSVEATHSNGRAAEFISKLSLLLLSLETFRAGLRLCSLTSGFSTSEGPYREVSLFLTLR